jgi:hypothetical protein
VEIPWGNPVGKIIDQWWVFHIFFYVSGRAKLNKNTQITCTMGTFETNSNMNMLHNMLEFCQRANQAIILISRKGAPTGVLMTYVPSHMRMQQQPPGKLTVCAWDKHIFLMSIYIYTYIYIHNQQTKWSF